MGNNASAIGELNYHPARIRAGCVHSDYRLRRAQRNPQMVVMLCQPLARLPGIQPAE